MTARHWTALITVSLLGIGLLVWLMPMAAQRPFLLPADVYRRFAGNGGSTKPFEHAGILVTPIAVGLAIVILCAFLYLWWISRPIVLRNAPRQPRDR